MDSFGQLANVLTAIQGWVFTALVVFGAVFILLNLVAFRWMRELSGGLDSQLSGFLPRLPMYGLVGGLVGVLGFALAQNATTWLLSVLAMGLVAGLTVGVVGAQVYPNHPRKGIFMLVGGIIGGPAGGLIGGVIKEAAAGMADLITHALIAELTIALAAGLAGAAISWSAKQRLGEAAGQTVFESAILVAGGIAGGLVAVLTQGLTWWLAGLTVALTVVLVISCAS